MSVGKRIQTFRERKSLSVEDLAKAAGIRVSVMEAIEAGEVVPVIGVMVKLARALGQRLGSFMDDQYEEDPLVVRASEHSSRESIGSGREDYGYYSLGRGKPDRNIEPFYVVLRPTEGEVSAHEGEEFIYVLKGHVELKVGPKTVILNEGDSAYYNSLLPHGLRAIDGDSADILASVYTPF